MKAPTAYTVGTFVYMSEPGYFAVIPADVRYANMVANAKLLYGEITALCSKHGYCWASNKYFADLYSVNDSTVERWIAALVGHGFIITEGGTRRRKILLPAKMRVITLKNEGTSNTVLKHTELSVKPTTKKDMRIYAESDEVPTIQEGDPTPVKGRPNRKHSETSIRDFDALIGLYTQLYLKYIGKTIPYTNRALVYRNMAEPLKHYGLPRMKELLEAYIASNDNYYRNEKWNILVFLSMRTLNKLEQ